MKRFFIGACLMAFALGAQAQFFTNNGDFSTGSSANVTVQTPQSITPSGVAGWDVVTANGQVFTQRVDIGASGRGDSSIVVYDDGQNGGISQTVAIDSPSLYVSADVYVQYGTAYLSSSNPVDGTTAIASTSQTGGWVHLSGIVPNQGAAYGQPAVVQVLSGDPNGSAFAVDNVVVRPADVPVDSMSTPANYPDYTQQSYDPVNGYYPPRGYYPTQWDSGQWNGGQWNDGQWNTGYVPPVYVAPSYVSPTFTMPTSFAPAYTDPTVYTTPAYDPTYGFPATVPTGYFPSVPYGYLPQVPVGQLPTIQIGQLPTIQIGQIPSIGIYGQ